MENDSEAEIEEVGSRLTCEICFEPVDSKNRFEYNTKGCSSDSYCVDCIAKYIEAMIQEYNTAHIKCPGPDCKELLDPVSCRPILPPRVFDLWCDALSESLFAKEGIYRSYCPNPDCSTANFSDSKNTVKVACAKCKGLFCFKCKIPWAPDHECRKYIERVGIEDTAFERLVVKKRWGRCPRCGYVVEKYAGCSVIKCRYILLS
ncbi:RBR-type E3 ubiquitin transferase [Ranunculus cassubicifolius]